MQYLEQRIDRLEKLVEGLLGAEGSQCVTCGKVAEKDNLLIPNRHDMLVHSKGCPKKGRGRRKR